MPIFEFEGKRPQVAESAWVAPTATLVGDVHVEEGAGIWYGAVLRADDCTIVVRRDANVQDNAVIHGRPGETVEIGEGATVAHGCIVHGATLARHALLGNGSHMMDGASLGEASMVGAGSLVPPDAHVGDDMMALGTPAREVRPVKGTGAAFFVDGNPVYYAELARRHASAAREI